MAYQIQYENNTIRIIRRSVKKEFVRAFLFVMVLVIAAVSAHIGGSALQALLLGQRDTTQAAAEQLVDDIQAGISVQDAVQTFYTELVQ